MSSGPPERTFVGFGLRLAAWYAALFILGMLGIIALSYALLARSLEQGDRETVRLTLATYASQYEMSGPNGLQSTLLAQEALGAHIDLFVRVLDPRHDVVFLSLPGRWTSFDLDRPETTPPLGTYSWERIPARSGSEVLDLASLLLPDGALLQVGRSTRGRNEVLRRFRALLGGLAAATVLVGLAGGALATRRGLVPIRRLAGTVGEIVRTGRLDGRVPERPGGDALDELVRLVNAMLDRIEALVAAMHGSLDAVAHDLRTPLMRLRAVAETSLAGDAESCREALASCLEEAERVRVTLDRLMDISEAEAGAMVLHPEAVSVRSVFDETLDVFGDLAAERGLSLRADDPAPLQMRADRVRLLQVLANLVDNALKYTPSGGEVRLAARREGDSVALTVSDSGIGIPAEDLPRIWDRLVRGDRSRAERGLGLGLSLVKAIVEAHGGGVEVESSPGQGTRFSVHLPAPPA